MSMEIRRIEAVKTIVVSVVRRLDWEVIAKRDIKDVAGLHAKCWPDQTVVVCSQADSVFSNCEFSVTHNKLGLKQPVF